MDRLLRPRILEIETTLPNAEKLYRHWKATFENYLDSSLTAVPDGTPGDDVSLATAATARAENDKKKCRALVNNVSSSIWELINDCNTYAEAIAILDTAFIRPTNLVSNRHELITTKQDAGQSIDTYVQSLQRIAKSCNFTAVTAEQYRNEYVRDAFINGITSASIRQRLLENMGELSLQQACTQARALEQAQIQSAAYDSNTIAALSTENEHDQLAPAGQKKPYRKSKNNKNNWKPQIPKENCMWCGNTPRHDRSDCPAKDDTCMNCKKPGHWAKVCLSSTAAALGSIGAGSANIADSPPQQHQASQSFQQLQQHQQQPYQPPFLQQNFDTQFLQQQQQQQQQQYHPISPNITHPPQLA